MLFSASVEASPVGIMDFSSSIDSLAFGAGSILDAMEYEFEDSLTFFFSESSSNETELYSSRLPHILPLAPLGFETPLANLSNHHGSPYIPESILAAPSYTSPSIQYGLSPNSDYLISTKSNTSSPNTNIESPTYPYPAYQTHSGPEATMIAEPNLDPAFDCTALYIDTYYIPNSPIPTQPAHSPPDSLGSPEISLSCTFPTCEKHFTSRTDYKDHYRYHTLAFQCSTCPRRFGTKKDLDRHINSKHLRTKDYYCSVSTCKKSREHGGDSFPRKDNCKRHMETVHGIVDEKISRNDRGDHGKVGKKGRQGGARKKHKLS